MIGTAQSKKMLYCPKCQQTYEESSQRFCDNDGGRLLPAPNSPKAPSKTTGVFTSLVGKLPQKQEQDEKLASIPRFSPTDFNSFFKEKIPDEVEVELELFPDMRSEPAGKSIGQPVTEPAGQPVAKPVQPLARIIKPSEIQSGTASVGNRQTNPTGRLALTVENPQVLIGQMVKGRYQIVEMLGQDESGIDYLAEDKIAAPKKYTVRVLTKETGEDDLMESIYAEERVWLSHVNHPNVVRVVDSGELLEGFEFIVSEYAGADSVRDLLKKSKKINALRTARIIRQAAVALSEVHQNGVLHRDLKPENILLTVNETGTEQIKLNGFGISDGRPNAANRPYKAPEVLESKLATVAGDVFSLAAIAYQMLTDRAPFGETDEREILRHQREGLALNPTHLRLDLSPAVDGVLEKAMSFKPGDRYPKARDFGDAFFAAVSTEVEAKQADPESFEEIALLPAVPFETTTPVFAESHLTKTGPIEPSFIEPEFVAPKFTESEVVEPETTGQFLAESQHFTEPHVSDETPSSQEPDYLVPAVTPEAYPEEQSFVREDAEIMASPVMPDISFRPQSDIQEIEVEKVAEAGGKINKSESEDPAWTRRSPELPKTTTISWMILSLIGVAVLLGGTWAIWSYAVKHQNQIEASATQASANTPVATPVEAPVPPNSELPLNIEVPPLGRQIKQPANTTYFQNTKQEMKGDLIRNFLGFSLYYPNDWTKQPIETAPKGLRSKFLDIARKSPNGQPVEQMLISYYESKGTFENDAPKFPGLVKEMSETLSRSLPNFQILSQGETKVNDWKAYEVRFQSAGTNDKGEKMILWGRRLFVPVVRAGANSGYEITMVATSLADNVKSVDDVGSSDELAKILETFEPNQSY